MKSSDAKGAAVNSMIRMKCDELQYERLGEANWAYPASTLVIRKQFVDEAIAELKSENERLNRELEHVKNGDCINTCDVVEKHVKEEIKAKRALWLARAERAVAEQTVDEWSQYKEKHPFGSWRADPFEYWVQAWIYVEKLCRKKAAEYK